MNQITDYLQTQALNLNPEAVAVSRAAAQAVLAHGQADIDRSLLLHDALPETPAQQTAALQAVFMALDSVCSRHPSVQHAAVYILLPEAAQIVRLAQYGGALADSLPVDEETAQHYLAVRTALSGWANTADDTARWLAGGALSGSHNLRTVSQTSLPVCGEDGSIYGVVHMETAAAPDADTLADWVGLALALLPLLGSLLHQDIQAA